MDEEGRRSLEEAYRQLDAMTPERCLRAARLLRNTKPRLPTDRQREFAEEVARRFEARAAAKAAGGSAA
jgi:hypothetical protein